MMINRFLVVWLKIANDMRILNFLSQYRFEGILRSVNIRIRFDEMLSIFIILVNLRTIILDSVHPDDCLRNIVIFTIILDVFIIKMMSLINPIAVNAFTVIYENLAVLSLRSD